MPTKKIGETKSKKTTAKTAKTKSTAKPNAVKKVVKEITKVETPKIEIPKTVAPKKSTTKKSNRIKFDFLRNLWAQIMLNKKVSLIILGFFVLLFGVVGFFFYMFWGRSSAVVSYIPKEFDQFFYMSMDDDLRNVINNAESMKSNQDLKDVIDNISQVGAYEYVTGDETISLMIAKVKKGFDINKAFKAGVIMSGDDYTYKKLKADLFIYGNKKSIEYFDNYKGDKIGDDNDIKDKVSELYRSKYNFAYFTKHFSGDNMAVNKFLEKMKYGVLVSHIGGDRPNGSLTAIFSEKLPFGQNYSFDSKLGNYLNNDTVLFLEAGNLLSFFNINKDQFSAIIGGLLGDTTELSKFLTKADYDKMASSIDGNIAISVTKSSNLLGIGGGLVFEKPELFDVINKFYPYLKAYVKATPSFSGVNFKEETDMLGVNMNMPFFGIMTDINVSLARQNDNLVLNLLGANMSKSDQKLNNNSKTILNFYLDADKFIDLMNKYSLFSAGASSVMPQNIDYLKGKKIVGGIELQDNKLLLNFDTQK